MKRILCAVMLAALALVAPSAQAAPKGIVSCVNEGEWDAVQLGETQAYVHNTRFDGYQGWLGDQWHGASRTFQYRIYNVCSPGTRRADLKFWRPFPDDGSPFKVCNLGGIDPKAYTCPFTKH